MIIFDKNEKHSLHDFGIEIPVHDSRAINTFNQLIAHPQLGTQIKAWHIDTINETITREDDSIKTLSIHMAHGWPLDGEPYDSEGNLNPSFLAGGYGKKSWEAYTQFLEWVLLDRLDTCLSG